MLCIVVLAAENENYSDLKGFTFDVQLAERISQRTNDFFESLITVLLLGLVLFSFSIFYLFTVICNGHF